MIKDTLRLPPLAAEGLVLTLALAACSGGGGNGVQSPTLPTTPGAQTTQSTRSITAQSFSTHLTSRPIADATHHYIYVGDAYSQAVAIYQDGPNPQWVGSITQGIGSVEGLAIDKNGTLYAANNSPSIVTIYPAGSTTPSLTLKQKLVSPAAVAVDPNGNVWVANSEGATNSSVVEFPAGRSTPSTVLSGLNYANGVAFDAQGNLYLTGGNAKGTAAVVSVYPPGATKPSRTFGGKLLSDPVGVLVGPSGDVYVADYTTSVVDVFEHGTDKFVRKVTSTGNDLGPITLSTDRGLYGGFSDTAVVGESGDYGKAGPMTQKIHGTLQSAFGVAADPAVAPGP